MIIRLTAGNDRNGNPRRVYVRILENGGTVGAWPDNYSGDEAIPAIFRHEYRGVTYDTTPAQYRQLVKAFGGQREVK